MKKGPEVQDTSGFKVGQMKIDCLEDGAHYIFLGAPECPMQNKKLPLNSAAKVYLQRLSVIWSSLLSNSNFVVASNQITLPVLSNLMWSHHWNLTDLHIIDRHVRNSQRMEQSTHSKTLIYLPRTTGGQGRI